MSKFFHTNREGEMPYQGFTLTRIMDGGYALKFRIGRLICGVRLRGSQNPYGNSIYFFGGRIPNERWESK